MQPLLARIRRQCAPLVLLAFLFFWVEVSGAQASAPPVSLPSTFEHVLGSRVNGREYRVSVALPPGYGTGAPGDTTRFPVLYMLDGGISLPLVSSIYRHGNVNSLAPVILVGIGWVSKGASFGPPAARTEDYTPTVVPQDDSLKTGGAAVFARVLREEIIPFVERSYRTIGDRGILGNSYGGLFEVYTLFEQPDLFQRYVIGSPSLWWDNRVMFARESQFARTNRKMRKRIFLAVGAEEEDGMKDDMSRFADSLRAHRYEGLELTTEVLTGEGHDGVVTALHGLRVLYPFLVKCELGRESGRSYRGRCTHGSELAAAVNLNPPTRQSPSLWRGTAKFSWRPQEEPFAVEMRNGGTLRTGTAWFDVTDTHVDSTLAVFAFDWDRTSRPTRVDLAILHRAKTYLSDSSRWDRSAMPDSLFRQPLPSEWVSVRAVACPQPTKRTFFCALYDASVEEAGEYWHGRPAMEAVRNAVTAATGGRLRHPVFGINSDSATTLAILQLILDDAARRVQQRLTVGNDDK